MKVPFGKHKGRDLREVPDDYLAWMFDLTDLRPSLAAAVKAEFYRRFPQKAPGAGARQPNDSGRATYGRSTMVVPSELRPVAEELITAGLKVLARKYHPDAGGNHEAMVRTNEVARLLRNLAGA